MSEDKLRDGRKRGFYIVDNDLIDKYGPAIGAYGVAVYNLIARYADNNGENAFPSYPTIAKKLNMSRTKVVQTIEQLVALGLIKKEQRIDPAGDLTSNLYTIVHIGSTPHVLPSTPHVLPSTPSEPQVVRHTDGGSTPHVPDQDTNNKTESNNTTPPSHSEAKAESSGGGSLPKNRNRQTDHEYAQICSKFESNGFGTLTAIMADEINALLNEFPYDWISDAMTVAISANKRQIRYVRGILVKWRSDGRQDRTTPTQAKPMLTLKQWCLKKYHVDNPKFIDAVSEATVYEQYNQYKQQFQQAH